MNYQISVTSISLFIVTTILSVAITFFLKDFFQKRTEQRNLRSKLDKIAGKNSFILYPVGTGNQIGTGNQLFKIIEIDNHGIILTNELQKIFVPISKLLQSEILIPCDNYDVEKQKWLKKEMYSAMDAMAPAIFDKLFPEMFQAIKETMFEDFEQEGEFSMAIGLKIKNVLSESGYEITKKKSLSI